MRRCFFSSPAWVNVDLHVYVLAEFVEHSHQPVNGEAAKLHVANAGKVRMADTGAAQARLNSAGARTGLTPDAEVHGAVPLHLLRPSERSDWSPRRTQKMDPANMRSHRGQWIDTWEEGHHAMAVSPAAAPGPFVTPGLADGASLAADPLGGMPGTADGPGPDGDGRGRLCDGAAGGWRPAGRGGGVECGARTVSFGTIFVTHEISRNEE